MEKSSFGSNLNKRRIYRLFIVIRIIVSISQIGYFLKDMFIHEKNTNGHIPF